MKKFTALRTTATLLCMLICAFALLFASEYGITLADGQVRAEEQQTEGEEAVSPRLFATLSLTIGGGDGKVYARAKNDFTLFMSTVVVVVELYYSDTYASDYTQMTLAAVNSTADLDMGTTITAEASTGGAEGYWLGRMRYKENNDDWKIKDTGVIRCSATGEFLGYS